MVLVWVVDFLEWMTFDFEGFTLCAEFVPKPLRILEVLLKFLLLALAHINGS